MYQCRLCFFPDTHDCIKAETRGIQGFSLPASFHLERAHPHLRNFRFIDEMLAWFRLEGAPSSPKERGDQAVYNYPSQGTIANRYSHRVFLSAVPT